MPCVVSDSGRKPKIKNIKKVAGKKICCKKFVGNIIKMCNSIMVDETESDKETLDSVKCAAVLTLIADGESSDKAALKQLPIVFITLSFECSVFLFQLRSVVIIDSPSLP